MYLKFSLILNKLSNFKETLNDNIINIIKIVVEIKPTKKISNIFFVIIDIIIIDIERTIKTKGPKNKALLKSPSSLKALVVYKLYDIINPMKTGKKIKE